MAEVGEDGTVTIPVEVPVEAFDWKPAELFAIDPADIEARSRAIETDSVNGEPIMASHELRRSNRTIPALIRRLAALELIVEGLLEPDAEGDGPEREGDEGDDPEAPGDDAGEAVPTAATSSSKAKQSDSRSRGRKSGKVKDKGKSGARR